MGIRANPLNEELNNETALLNGMVLLGVNPYLQQIIRGAVVLIAVPVNVWRTRRSPIS
jgi:simple sugar transport system permease protein